MVMIITPTTPVWLAHTQFNPQIRHIARPPPRSSSPQVIITSRLSSLPKEKGRAAESRSPATMIVLCYDYFTEGLATFFLLVR